MAAAMAFILFVVSSGNLPDFTALAAFDTQAACDAAATTVNSALSSGQDPKHALCLTTESLSEMAKKNGISGQ